MKKQLIVSGLVALGSFAQAEFNVDKSVMSDKYWEVWNDAEQAKIDAAIEANRKADCTVTVDAPAGTEVTVEQLDHEFRFGAHIFNFDQLINREWKTRLSLVSHVAGPAPSARSVVKFRGFRGKYRLTWKGADGKPVTKDIRLQ